MKTVTQKLFSLYALLLLSLKMLALMLMVVAALLPILIDMPLLYSLLYLPLLLSLSALVTLAASQLTRRCHELLQRKITLRRRSKKLTLELVAKFGLCSKL